MTDTLWPVIYFIVSSLSEESKTLTGVSEDPI